ncbi:hypothetical protein DEV91_12410 [Phyllobacterium brassicacearum]|nr:hypothetical protein DEV91_12410 [Phyllobacterium brassicacearum]
MAKCTIPHSTQPILMVLRLKMFTSKMPTLEMRTTSLLQTSKVQPDWTLAFLVWMPWETTICD